MKKYLLFILFSAFSTFTSAQAITWQYYTGAPSFGSSAAADLDKDGFYEIVFSTYTNDGRVHCLNAEDGSVRWIYNIGGCGDVAPIIADVDNDDTLDVIVNGSCNPTIFCINGYTGQLKWSKPSGGGDSPPTVANMDNDSMPEILFCNFNGQLRILNGEDGSTNETIQVDPNFNPIQTEPTLVDVNNDGHLDIIMANYYNITGLYVWAYDYATQDTLWTNFMADTSTFNAYHGGAVADVDGDGLLEYVIGSNNGLVRALNVEDGSTLWSIPIPASDMAPISIADLDKDGDLEVVVTNNDWITYDERIWVLNGLNGSVAWSYATTFSSFRGCAIADINGDDTLDLVAGYYMGDVIAVQPFSGLIWQTNLLQYFPPGLPYFDVDHGPLVADFDHNGTMNVFVVAGYGTYTPDSQNTGKAFMIEAGTGKCPEWLMFRQDAYRSGYLSQQDADSSCSVVLIAPEHATESFDLTLYPNPTCDELFVTMNKGIFDTKKLRLSIYNVNGQEIILPSNCYSVDRNNIHINLKTLHLASGTYVLDIQNETGELKKEFILME